MLTRYDKALAALIVSGAVPIINHLFGMNITPDMQAIAVTVLATFFVYVIPNRT